MEEGLRAIPTLLTAPMLGASGVVLLALFLALRRPERLPRRGRGLPAALLVLLAALLAGGVAREVAAPSPPLARAVLESPGEDLLIPQVGGSLSALVHTDLPPLSRGRSASLRYGLTLLDGEDRLLEHSGILYERWGRRRVGRRSRIPVLLRRDEERIDLPPGDRSPPWRLLLTKLEGEHGAPLVVEIVRGPPGQHTLIGLLVLLVVSGGLLEALEASGARLSTFLGFLGFFALLLPGSLTPGAPIQAVAPPTLLALVLGVPMGWMNSRLLSALSATLGVSSRPPAPE